MSYCDYVKGLQITQQNVHKKYHDHHYGFPINDDNELFERLVLEINQAGLSWETILKKQEGFKKAYNNFDIETVANYKDDDKTRLLNDSSIIRNKLKIEAAIHNAKVIVSIQKEHGSFKNWLDIQHPKPKEEWVKLFKKTFKFTGGEIVNEFLMSSGYLAGAHDECCPVYDEVLKHNPAWIIIKS
ncbi:MAG: DNA-3-methyladenine glycosylase I [Dysgonomonas sp.]